MVHSMTAFARVEQAGTHGTLSWELRSVNHRYLEPHLRLPDAFRDLEGAVREALRQGLSRGKVECTLRFAEETAGKSLQVDQERASQLIAAAESVAALIRQPAAIDPLQVLGLEVGIGRDCLDHVLAVVEDTLEGDVEDVRVVETEHLRLLERAHAAVRAEHEDLDAGLAAHRVLGRRTGITGGRAEDVQFGVVTSQRVLEEVADQLHRHVLEGERGAVGQALEVHAVLQLAQNAVQHTAEGDRIHLASRWMEREPGRWFLELAVADHGPGVPPAIAERIAREQARVTEARQRDDDREETVRNRLSVYREQTRPLVDYYSSWAQKDPAGAPKYRKISGVGAVDEIKSRLFEAVKS